VKSTGKVAERHISVRIKVRTTIMDDQEFKNRADQSLEALYRRLAAATNDADFEVDFNSGALAIEFEEPPGKFVISPNAPVHQIWVSAHSKSYKLDWDSTENDFVLPSSRQTLTELIQDAIAKQLGEEVSL
jgi:iron donor protein CyaY